MSPKMAMSIEPIDDKTYRIMLQEDNVIIGDSEAEEFKPLLKLTRWRGEAFLKLRFDDKAIMVKSHRFEEDKVKWETPLLDLHFYSLDPTEQYEHGGVEFEIILKAKPPVNLISLPIETENLKFFYQPPLTQEEIDRGAFRPDNVVGSYAVYHDSKRNNKYKCGKAFHIYRPHLQDALGREAWADLSISDGFLTITVPQNLLDQAVYPVTVDPTFGKTDVGSSSGNIFGYEWAGAYDSPASDGTVTSISIYTTSTGLTVRGCIYSDEAGPYPDAVLEEGGPTNTVQNDWTEITGFNTSVLSANSYWLGLQQSAGGSYIKYDSGVDPDSAYKSHTYGAFTNPFPGPNGETRGDFYYSIYATYTAVAGLSIPVAMKHYRSMRT